MLPPFAVIKKSVACFHQDAAAEIIAFFRLEIVNGSFNRYGRIGRPGRFNEFTIDRKQMIIRNGNAMG